jgi:hypothetical protein
LQKNFYHGLLAKELHAQSSFRHWAVDLVTPTIKQQVNRRWGRNLTQAQTHYQFAPENGAKFFLSYGWCEAEFHALFENSIRVNRTVRRLWMFRLIELLAPKNAADMIEKWHAGVVLLQRTQ